MCQAALTITVGDVQSCFVKKTTLQRRVLVEEEAHSTPIAIGRCSGFRVELEFGDGFTDGYLWARCMPLSPTSSLFVHKLAVYVFDEKMEPLFDERFKIRPLRVHNHDPIEEKFRSPALTRAKSVNVRFD